LLTNRFIACSRWIFQKDDARKIEARRIGVAKRVLAFFFLAMVPPVGARRNRFRAWRVKRDNHGV